MSSKDKPHGAFSHLRNMRFICKPYAEDESCDIADCPFSHHQAKMSHIPRERCKFDPCKITRCDYFHGSDEAWANLHTWIAARDPRPTHYMPVDFMEVRDPREELRLHPAESGADLVARMTRDLPRIGSATLPLELSSVFLTTATSTVAGDNAGDRASNAGSDARASTTSCSSHNFQPSAMAPAFVPGGGMNRSSTSSSVATVPMAVPAPRSSTGVPVAPAPRSTIPPPQFEVPAPRSATNGAPPPPPPQAMSSVRNKPPVAVSSSLQHTGGSSPGSSLTPQPRSAQFPHQRATSSAGSSSASLPSAPGAPPLAGPSMPVAMKTPNIMMLKGGGGEVLAWFCPQCSSRNDLMEVVCSNCELEKPWTCGLCHTPNFGSRKTCIGCKVATRPVLPRPQVMQMAIQQAPSVPAQPQQALPNTQQFHMDSTVPALATDDDGPSQLDQIWGK